MSGSITEQVRTVPILTSPERTLDTGLCRDCVSAPTCTFPRDPTRPIWSCDEFKPPSSVSAPGQPAAAGTAGMERTEPEDLKGLCRYCVRRPTCQYPKLPGGVWHCDELE